MQLNLNSFESLDPYSFNAYLPEIQDAELATDGKVSMQSHLVGESFPVPNSPHSEALSALNSWVHNSWQGGETDTQEIPFTPEPTLSTGGSTTSQTSTTPTLNNVIDLTGSGNSKRSRPSSDNGSISKRSRLIASSKRYSEMRDKQEITRNELSKTQYTHLAFKYLVETQTPKKIKESFGGKKTFLDLLNSSGNHINVLVNFELRQEWKNAITEVFSTSLRDVVMKKVVDLFMLKDLKSQNLPECIITRSASINMPSEKLQTKFIATSRQLKKIIDENPPPPVFQVQRRETQEPPALNSANGASMDQYAFLVIKHCLTKIGKSFLATSEEDRTIVANMLDEDTSFVTDILNSKTFESLANYRLREKGRVKIDSVLVSKDGECLDRLNQSFKKKGYYYLEEDPLISMPSNSDKTQIEPEVIDLRSPPPYNDQNGVTDAPSESDMAQTDLPEYDLQLAEPEMIDPSSPLPYNDQNSATAFSGHPIPFFQSHLQPITYQISPETFNNGNFAYSQLPPFYFNGFNP